MGSRDESIIDEERADAAIRNVLAAWGEPTRQETPPDFVARTARQLSAARRAEQRTAARAWRRGVIASVSTVIIVFAIFNIAQSFGFLPPTLALLGDGTSGASRVLLTVHLLVKPLLRTLSAVEPWLLVVATLAIIGAAWAWWRVFERTPAVVVVEAIQ